MEQLKTPIKIKSWPTPQDYNLAVQNLHANLRDPELRAGQVERGAHGLPIPRSGAFASVYRIAGRDSNWALRCFLREVSDSHERYLQIARFVQSDSLPCTVGFDFQTEGLRVGSFWFPILKMEWVEGETLDNYLIARRGQISPLLAESFLEMCLDLQAAGIAHGDLQHGNIIISDEQFYLVDYDGMYVPGMDGWRSNELGHRNYQHPRRNADTFGPYMDNFAAWNIYTSLLALSVDSSLFHRLQAGEDCLLFRREDFVDPLNSCAFAALESSQSPELVMLSRFIRHQASELNPEQVPPLHRDIPNNFDLPPLNAGTPLDRLRLARTAGNEASMAVDRGCMERVIDAHTEVDRSQMQIIASGDVEPELKRCTPRTVLKSQSMEQSEWMLTFLISFAVAGSFSLWFGNQVRTDTFLILLFAGIAVMRFFCSFSNPRYRDLVENGLATRGRIIKFETVDENTLNYTYRYFHQGEGRYVINVMIGPRSRRSQLGVEVTVLYSPQTRRSAIYALCDARAGLE